MIFVPVSEFRSHMAKYLSSLTANQSISLISHGKVVAEIRKPEDTVQTARKRLEEIARHSLIFDIESPAFDDWGTLS